MKTKAMKPNKKIDLPTAPTARSHARERYHERQKFEQFMGGYWQDALGKYKKRRHDARIKTESGEDIEVPRVTPMQEIKPTKMKKGYEQKVPKPKKEKKEKPKPLAKSKNDTWVGGRVLEF